MAAKAEEPPKSSKSSSQHFPYGHIGDIKANIAIVEKKMAGTTVLGLPPVHGFLELYDVCLISTTSTPWGQLPWLRMQDLSGTSCRAGFHGLRRAFIVCSPGRSFVTQATWRVRGTWKVGRSITASGNRITLVLLIINLLTKSP